MVKNIFYKKFNNLFINIWPYTLLLVFIRFFIVRVDLFGIHKNINPLYIFLGFLALWVLIVEIFFQGLIKFFKEYKVYILIVLVIVVANTISIFFSVNKQFSFLFFIQLSISYLLGMVTVIWVSKLQKQYNNHESRTVSNTVLKFYKILIALNIYDFVLSIIQFFTIAYFKERYLQLPNIVRRLIFNGYFIESIPTQRWDFSSYFIRPPGLLGDTNVNAMFILFSLLTFLVLFLFLGKLDLEIKPQSIKKIRIFLVIVMVIDVFTYMLSFSRTALLGFMIIAIVMLILLLFYYKDLFIKLVQTILFMIIAAFLIFTVSFLTVPYIQKFTINNVIPYTNRIMDFKNDRSVYLHFLHAKWAIQLAKQNDYKPWGLGEFPAVFKKELSPNSKNGASPHSMYATVLMEQGMVGLILYLFGLIFIWINFLTVLRRVFKENKLTIIDILKLTLNIAIPFLSISTMFYYGFWDIQTWFWGIHAKETKKS